MPEENCGSGRSLVLVLVLDSFVFRETRSRGKGQGSPLAWTTTSRFDALRLLKALSLSKGTYPVSLGGRSPKATATWLLGAAVNHTRLSIVPIRPILTKRTQSVLKQATKAAMRLALTLTIHLIAIASLHAGWTFSPAEPQKAPPGLEFTQRRAGNGGRTAELSIVSFSPKTHTFAVMDNPTGAFDAGSAALKRGALAAVNGGYFHPDRAPLGLAVRQGAVIHPLEKAKLLSGLVVVAGDHIALRRTSEFKASPAIREALQAGPFLVDAGKPVAGLDNTRSAARTVVFIDSTGRCGFLICKSLTLAEMADLLAAPSLFASGKITRALNLDGGSSTALWVRSEPVFYEREWKSVRNYLAIVPKP